MSTVGRRLAARADGLLPPSQLCFRGRGVVDGSPAKAGGRHIVQVHNGRCPRGGGEVHARTAGRDGAPRTGHRRDGRAAGSRGRAVARGSGGPHPVLPRGPTRTPRPDLAPSLPAGSHGGTRGDGARAGGLRRSRCGPGPGRPGHGARRRAPRLPPGAERDTGSVHRRGDRTRAGPRPRRRPHQVPVGARGRREPADHRRPRSPQPCPTPAAAPTSCADCSTGR